MFINTIYGSLATIMTLKSKDTQCPERRIKAVQGPSLSVGHSQDRVIAIMGCGGRKVYPQ